MKTIWYWFLIIPLVSNSTAVHQWNSRKLRYRNIQIFISVIIISRSCTFSHLILNMICGPFLTNVSSPLFCKTPNMIPPMSSAMLGVQHSLILGIVFPVFWCFPFGNDYSTWVFEWRMIPYSLEGSCTYFCFNSADLISKFKISETCLRVQQLLYK